MLNPAQLLGVDNALLRNLVSQSFMISTNAKVLKVESFKSRVLYNLNRSYLVPVQIALYIVSANDLSLCFPLEYFGHLLW